MEDPSLAGEIVANPPPQILWIQGVATAIEANLKRGLLQSPIGSHLRPPRCVRHHDLDGQAPLSLP
jgi:hypothetical protein